jgi:AcrR family transcriptional regulator
MGRVGGGLGRRRFRLPGQERSAVARSQDGESIARGRASSGQSTRRRIQDAALQLFAAKGFFATGIREIADRVGVTTAALYHYMGSKDELLIEIMVSSMTQLIRAAEESLATADEPAAELAALVRAHVGYHALDPLRSMVNDDELRAVSGKPRAHIMELRDSYERLWAGTLDRGLASGVFHVADAKITRLALLEMCNGVDRWYSSTGPMGPGEVADVFADLALAMVGARRNGQPVRLSSLACAPTEQVLKIAQRALQEICEGD